MGKKKTSMKDRVRRNSKEAANKGARYIKLPEGVEFYKIDTKRKHIFDIIPYEVTDKKHLDGCEVGDIWYKKPVKIHYGVGGGDIDVVCLKTFGKACPICEEHSKMRNDPDVDEETAKALRPKDRVLYCIRPLNGKQKDKLCVFEIAAFNFQDVLDEEINDPEDGDAFADFVDIEGGSSLKVRFTEKSFSGRAFIKADRIDLESRDDLDKETLESAINLDEILVVKSYKEIKALYNEDEDDGEKEEDDDIDLEPKEKEEPEDKQEPEKKTEVDEEIEDEKPKRTKKEPDDEKPKRSKKSKTECPHGHDFADDVDKKDECDKCDIWDKCLEASGS